MALWEKYHSGAMTKDAFQRENEKVSEQTAKYEAQIAELNTEIKKLELSAGMDGAFVERYAGQIGITELTQTMVDEFVKEIRVYTPDRIEVVLNYADEFAIAVNVSTE
jgi:sugar-specific transcriptional regulator TrmB